MEKMLAIDIVSENRIDTIEIIKFYINLKNGSIFLGFNSRGLLPDIKF